MKTRHLFFSLLAGMALGACSSNDVLEPDVQNVVGDQSYLSIRLVTPGSTLSRGEDGGFEMGNETENAVGSADFYFYNADGTYNQCSSYSELNWKSKTEGNVEKIADAVVVLRNLKQKGTPKYVVAVLNDAQRSYENVSLGDLASKTVDAYNTAKGFLISNSTYDNKDANSNYFATEIANEKFLKEKIDPETLNNDNAVAIYVERLACKVLVDVKDKLLNADNKITLTEEFEIDGVKGQKITLEIKGWGLNALTKNSYTMKNVPAWNYTLGEFEWSDADNYRSYWAESTNYGSGTYPNSYGSTVTDGQSNIETAATLSYIGWDDLIKGVGEVDYCMENTNTKQVLEAQNFKAAVTHVLLKAQISGVEDYTLVRFYGKLYTKENYIKNALNQLGMNVYKVTTGEDGQSDYTSINVNDIEPMNTYDGTVTLTLNEEALQATWSKSGTSTEPIAATAIAEKLQAVAAGADYYTDGMMYYCIPIEHLRGGAIEYTTTDAGEATYTVDEADYGVVRNHYYKLMINKISKLGTAVYDPDEPIVPNPEEQTYYVGATLNILSWKVVNQNVDL